MGSGETGLLFDLSNDMKRRGWCSQVKKRAWYPNMPNIDQLSWASYVEWGSLSLVCGLTRRYENKHGPSQLAQLWVSKSKI